jgi:alpha-tubulin suppressor-like RCC1 family protein
LGLEVNNITIPYLISTLMNIKTISSGGKHSIILDKFGNIFGFGSNDVNLIINFKLGQLGIGKESINQSLPIKLEINDIKKISSGGFHTILLNNNGEVLSFGSNNVFVL